MGRIPIDSPFLAGLRISTLHLLRTYAGRWFNMVRFSLLTTFVAYAGLAVMNTVTAGPTVTETNSTQIIPSVYKPAPNNPFAGLSLDLEISPRSMELVTRSVSEVELETRQFAQIAKAAVDVISKVVDLVKGIIEKDKERRSKFTQEVVSAGMKAHPEFNWIICHVKHHYKFKGTENKDWGKRHEEYSVSFGRTIG
ncbi:hypothetical protein H0H93_001261 [Arthromyces matolae]|nr:hypothetical protein H0H93_001261 [Arthromyces matolae]